MGVHAAPIMRACPYYTKARNNLRSLLVTIFMFLHVVIHVVSGASESETLIKFKGFLENNKALTSWRSGTTPCSGNVQNWVGVHCLQGKVWGLKLENMGLKGVINVESLMSLPHLRTLSFMNNHFDGPLPDLKKLPALKSVYLSHNNFSGPIPSDAFFNMLWLKKLHLAHNKFTGAIPISLSPLPKLLELRLENNQFEGKIPDLRYGQSLQSFNVSYNNLDGLIPGSLAMLDSSCFLGESIS
ncbi:hypothetical protein CMV_012741 [Castanea mollissima]|uniref:Leucine-rich repeat-containing N-terminal plant-type domain-containing protein n=1 Tax=Castanea mollissima TaxID=60419 RepID=A0A8J4RE95_9ROSI|nr:hypothetical protein CMV_012741 [Castanea mollissima]